MARESRPASCAATSHAASPVMCRFSRRRPMTDITARSRGRLPVLKR